jgi:hypothetical protein
LVIGTLQQRAGWAGIGCACAGNNILNVAPVSTKYLSFVNSSFKKMRPAFAGKCMAVAVACLDSAAEPVKVWQRFSFPKRSREKCTLMLCCLESCDIYTCHYLGFGKQKNLSRREDDFWKGHCYSFCRSSSS